MENENIQWSTDALNLFERSIMLKVVVDRLENFKTFKNPLQSVF